MANKTKAQKVKVDEMWERLSELTDEFAAAAIADSWKGGGDPLDGPVIEAELLKTKYALEAHISKIRREYE
jgi:hypothetical protein